MNQLSITTCLPYRIHRTLRHLMVLALLAWAQGAIALGLGDIEVRSFLGQPLHARIELLSRSPDELAGVSARLASADSFHLVGLDRMALSVPLQFTVHPGPDSAFVEVRSLDPVNDPVVQFVVEVAFANGRLLRQYTVFLDPPTVRAPVPLPALSARSSRPLTAPEPVTDIPREVPGADAVAPAEMETAASPAVPDAEPARAEADDPIPTEPASSQGGTTGAAPVQPEEPAEPEGQSPQNAEEAEESTVPARQDDASPQVTEEPSPPADGAEAAIDSVEAGVDELQPAEPATSEPQAGVPAQESGALRPAAYQVTQAELETYGPVKRGQTLWGIASEVSTDSGYSINQVMLAIQRYNPSAFGRDNINLLRSGAILRLPPPSEMDRLSVRAAMLESMRQAEDYADLLAGRAPEFVPAPIIAEAGESGPTEARHDAAAVEDDEGRLELVPPNEQAIGDSAAAGTGPEAEVSDNPDGPGDSALLSEEAREVVAQESEHLSERLRELQQELEETGAVANVEDQGLAELEQRLRDQRVAPDPEPVATVAPEGEGLSRISGFLPWLATALLVLVGAGAFWWLRRRGGSAMPASPAPADPSSDTARAIAEEAEDILRTLETDGQARDSDAGGEGRGEAPVIDLEDYIGHLERETSSGDDEEAPVPEGEGQEEPASSDDSRSGPEDDHPADPSEPEPVAGDDPVPFWEDGDISDPGEGSPQPSGEAETEDGATDPETKLDLARAYIAMGDKDAARELLEEVMREGDEKQVEEARSMMDET